jgi:hypothetical protein
MRGRDRSHGIFEFAADRENIARVFIKFETKESVVNDQPVPAEVVAQTAPIKMECTVREDGTIAGTPSGGPATPQFFFDALLPLAAGERKLPHGTVRTKLAGFFKVGRRECARLESEFDVERREPAGTTVLRGRTVGYFSLDERCFVQSETAIAQSDRTKARDEKGVWIVRSVDSESVLQLRLIEK